MLYPNIKKVFIQEKPAVWAQGFDEKDCSSELEN